MLTGHGATTLARQPLATGEADPKNPREQAAGLMNALGAVRRAERVREALTKRFTVKQNLPARDTLGRSHALLSPRMPQGVLVTMRQLCDHQVAGGIEPEARLVPFELDAFVDELYTGAAMRDPRAVRRDETRLDADEDVATYEVDLAREEYERTGDRVVYLTALQRLRDLHAKCAVIYRESCRVTDHEIRRVEAEGPARVVAREQARTQIGLVREGV